MHERRFQLPQELGGTIIFTIAVLTHMYRHAQVRFWQREAGGQLFSANPHEGNVVLSLATGPYLEDRRSRCGFTPNIQRVRLDVQQNFANGLHSVGLWHTHPEACPSPSPTDRETAHAYLAGHSTDMNGFLLVTLGNHGSPPSLSVYLADRRHGDGWVRLEELAATSVADQPEISP
ncbi:MAG: Mov34/MPN/PAD-1 family protein [Pseudomonadota bacterium]